MTIGVVSAIWLHPIKSCRKVAAASATVSPTGLDGDRDWQVASGEGPATQRRHPQLATVQPEPIDGGLRISAPGRATIEVERPSAPDSTAATLLGATAEVSDAGDKAATWFSELLGADVRLVARPPRSPVPVPESLDVFTQSVTFVDLAPVLVANTASLAWLAARASEPFGMERFRPNLVVDTTEPFAEDTWARFRLGPAQLRQGAPWPRCTIPQVDQETGERNREPALVLRAHRWCTAAPSLPPAARSLVEHNPVFGVGCSIGPPGAVVAVGDELQVDEVVPTDQVPLTGSPEAE